MTSRHVLILLASHLAVLGLAYQICQANHAKAKGDADSPGAATKVSDRGNSTSGSGGDGDALLASFMAGLKQNPKHSAYESLKATLPVADDPEVAVIAAIRDFANYEPPDNLDEEDAERREAEVAVRVLHWLRQTGDPSKVMGFLMSDPGARKNSLLASFSWTAIQDAAAEQGILKSTAWL